MPNDLLQLAAECNATGIGSPLLSNDDVVIPALQQFGYAPNDAFNYITSACWEPFCYGKALGRGNLSQINFAKAFENTYLDPGFTNQTSFDSLLSIYKQKLKAEVQAKIRGLDTIRWDKNPLMTLFTKGCLEKNKDISEGGAIYNDYGILSVGLANTIDSLFNIKKLCYDKPEKTLSEVKQILRSNYENNENLRIELNQNSFYGHSDPNVLKTINELVEIISKECNDYKNYLGGKLKFGLSSFAYMDEGRKILASFDGRKSGNALSTHMSSKLGEPYTELINFAGSLDYNGIKSNGNVVDFFVSPSFIQNNIEKFCIFLHSSIKVGFFQMQMNVVSSETLIAAKRNPELYPNIIVRVWGFSAYFKDLPEEYKDLLIKRALESEMVA
jgi:formate C-acetyltransferase